MTSLIQRQRELPNEVEAGIRKVLGSSQSATRKWCQLVQLLRENSAHPDLYRQIWDDCFGNWNASESGPAPHWLPDPETLRQANLSGWMNQLGFTSFEEFHQWSVEHREEFWQQSLERLRIRFRELPLAILNLNDGAEDPHWLPAARLNIVESCFQAPLSDPAIIFQRPGSPMAEWSYDKLLSKVREVASAIRAAGFQPGEALAVVLPMTPDAVAIYLGIVWAGCVVVSIADSFAAPEIANRLRIAKARAVFTYDEQLRSGKAIQLYERVREATHSERVIVLSSGEESKVKLRPQDCDWREFLTNAEGGQSDPHIGSPHETINILFSSGTTGDPKAIPWNHLTPLKCAIDAYCHQDIQPGHRVAWPTNLGWMMGPFLIFASLINRATIALYEDAPLGPGFGQFVQDARVNMLGVVPTIVKAWRTSACMENFDWTQIHVFSSTGESSQRDDMFYLSALAGIRPIIEYCGGTEIGGGFITSTVIQPNSPATFSTPAVGIDFLILDEEHRPAKEGELFLIPPSIGLSQRLLNRDHHQTYYAGTPQVSGQKVLRRHGDHFRRLPGNYFVAGGRVDDTMNLGGIKVSSAELERVMNLAQGVRETAAVAIADGGPEELVVFAVLAERRDTAGLLHEFNELLKSKLNPLFRAREVRIMDSLPRTASNKVLRRELRAAIVKR